MKPFIILAAILCTLSLGMVDVKSQITSSRSGRDLTELMVERADSISNLLSEARIAFVEGLLAYSEHDLRVAGYSFNRSVEIFLYSTFNLQREPKLKACYGQLIETIYRIEFPFNTQDPQLRELSNICSWNIDDSLIGNVTKQVALKAGQQYVLTDEQAQLSVNQQEKKVNALEESKIKLDAARSKWLEVLRRIDGDPKNESELQKAKEAYFEAYDKYYHTKGALNGADGGPSPFPPNAKDALSLGFITQTFEPSPHDELAKHEELDKTKKSNPKGTLPQTKANTRIVKARAGDTVQKLAEREKADPIEVANLNRLLPHSVLGAGREIKLPRSRNDPKDNNSEASAPISGKLPIAFGDYRNNETTVVDKAIVKAKSAGPRPAQDRKGRYVVVMNYFYEYLHDPYSMRIVRWSPLTSTVFLGENHWRVAVRYRAKNKLGAYVLSERVFYIRNNKIISTFELD